MTKLPVVREYTDAQGVTISFYEWPVAKPKAVVQLVHGLGEHAMRYDHVAIALNRAGYSVYADDHRGHGVTGKRMSETGLSKHTGDLGPGGMKATYAHQERKSRGAGGTHRSQLGLDDWPVAHQPPQLRLCGRGAFGIHGFTTRHFALWRL
jgi:pimeloyl-ACP methyl ester carboxylesterase